MAHNNGVISAPVDIRGDIAAVLGVQSGDLADLCQSTAINPWSKVKPVRHTSPGVGPGTPVLQIMKEANYGFGGLDEFFSTDDIEMFESYINNGGEWVYLKPEGTAENHPFRALDFDGYDHNSGNRPIDVAGVVVLPEQGNPRRLSFSFTVNNAASISLLDFSIADLNSYDSTSEDNNYKYAVMMRERGSSAHPTIYYGINVFKLENGQIIYNHRQEVGANEVIVFNAPSGGVYELVPCIIRHAPSALTHGNVVYLPAGTTYVDNGGSSLTPYVDTFQLVSKTVTRISSAADLEAGTGTMDITMRVTGRVLRWLGTFDPYCPIRIKTRSGNNVVNGGTISISPGVSTPTPYSFDETKTFLMSNDNALRLPVPDPIAGVVYFWADFYDYGDNLLGSELIYTLV